LLGFLWWRSWGGEGLELGSGVQISKLALGSGLRLRALVGPILKLERPPRLLFDWLAKESHLDDLANQSKCLKNRGLVIGWPGLPVGAQRAFRFSRLLARDQMKSEG